MPGGPIPTTHEPAIPGSYVLEVSSPGVDRPLTESRHWRRNVNRLVAVTRSDGSVITGRVRATDQTSAVLVDDETRVETTVPYADVERAVVQVELRPKRDQVTDVGDDLDDLADET